MLALRFEEHDGQVVVQCLDVRTGARVEHRARRLVLAAGTLGTARIVLRSLGSGSDVLPLLCNPYSYVPCIQPALVGARTKPLRMSLAQLSMFHDPDKANRDVAMGSIYSYRSLMMFRILPQAPIGMADARVLMRYLMPAITIVGIHHPEGPGPGRHIGLERVRRFADGRPPARRIRPQRRRGQADRRSRTDLHPSAALPGCLGDQAHPARHGLEHPLCRHTPVRDRRPTVLRSPPTDTSRARQPSRWPTAQGSGTCPPRA